MFFCGLFFDGRRAPHETIVGHVRPLTTIFNRPVPPPHANGLGLGIDYRPVKKTFAWKSLTKNKGKAHIYQDVLVMGSIYVIKS